MFFQKPPTHKAAHCNTTASPDSFFCFCAIRWAVTISGLESPNEILKKMAHHLTRSHAIAKWLPFCFWTAKRDRRLAWSRNRTGSFSIANVAFGACCAPSSWELEAIAAWSVLNCGSVFIRERDSCGALCVCVCVFSLDLGVGGLFCACARRVRNSLTSAPIFFFVFFPDWNATGNTNKKRKRKGQRESQLFGGWGELILIFCCCFVCVASAWICWFCVL